MELCNTVKIVGVLEGAIHLHLFSFSLAREAKRWLHMFKGNSLRTWEEVMEKLLKKYFQNPRQHKARLGFLHFISFQMNRDMRC